MDFQIRQAVQANVINDSAASFSETISDAIERGDEQLLPGLGVFLEAWWQSSNDQARAQFTDVLEQHYKQ